MYCHYQLIHMQWGLSRMELAAVQCKSKRWQAQNKVQDNLFKHHKKLFSQGCLNTGTCCPDRL